MRFGIYVLGDETEVGAVYPGESALAAELHLGTRIERLTIPIHYWNIEQYKKQWIDAIERASLGTKSALFTQVFDPKNLTRGYVLECWPLYISDQEVLIQNCYIESVSAQDISIENIYDYLDDFSPNQGVGQDGCVDEWKIPIEQLNDYLLELKKVF